MAETEEFQPTVQEAAIEQWITSVLQEGGFATAKVVFSRQGMPRVNRPFLTIFVLNDDEDQEPEVSICDIQIGPGNEYQQKIVERRSGTVQIDAFGSAAHSMLRAVERSRLVPGTIALNTANGIEIVDRASPMQNVSALMSVVGETRWTQDYRFAYAETTLPTTGVGVVQRVIGTGTITAPDGTECDADIDESWPTP